MGVKDSDALHTIYEKAKTFCKENNLPYSFKVDDGSFETAIEFWEMGYYHPPHSQNWEEAEAAGTEIKCPDLLDYDHKLIIEYEEEHGNQKNGAKLAKKGHSHKGDIDTKKDLERNMLYQIAGFRLLRLYDSDKDWKKLENFLLNCAKTE